MSINAVNSGANYVPPTTTNTTSTDATEKTASSAVKNEKEEGVVFEKTSETKTDSSKSIYSKDSVIAKLKSDQESRMASLQSLVEKLLVKQGDKFNSSLPLAAQFRKAAQAADPATILQAQKDVAEDGYWGVEQTSERLAQMAIALSGGDKSKADTMIAAMKKGFDQATKAWGEKLPDICQKTMDTAIEKVNKWKNGDDTTTKVAAVDLQA